MARAFLAACAAVLVLGSAQAAERSDERGRAEAAVVEALAVQPSVSVLVTFDVVDAGAGRPVRRFLSPDARALLARKADELLARLPATNVTVKHRFETLSAVALEIDADGLAALLEQPAVSGVGLDLEGAPELLESIPLAEIHVLHELKHRGKGVGVAVIDSGAERTHPSLRRQIKSEECFCSDKEGCCPNGTSRQSGRGAAFDAHGHGTRMAGIIAGRGRAAPRGVAFKAKVHAYRVFDRSGRICCFSDVLRSLEHILIRVLEARAQGEDAPIRVVNISLSTDALFAGNCDKKVGVFGTVFSTVVNDLASVGVSIFASSGNDASGKKMGLPACIKRVNSVAAAYDDDFASATWTDCRDQGISAGDVTCFSNTNAKTDVLAPGAPITAAGTDGGVLTASGTSQASAMTAGCAALLVGAYPEVPAATITRALESSSTTVRDPKNRRRLPLLNCREALEYLVAELE